MSGEPSVTTALSRVLRRLAVHPDKKLKVVIGDGIDPVAWILKPSDVESNYTTDHGGEEPSPADLRRYAWHWYEQARFWTFNNAPSFGYFLLYHLTRKGLLDAVITTNYDMVFDALATRTKAPFAINPSCPNPSMARVWKIHGSLAYATFPSCPIEPHNLHAFRLPEFPVSNDTGQVRPELSTRAVHSHSPGELPCRSVRIASDDPNGVAHHLMDWGFGGARAAFQQEIAAAERELLAPDTYALVLIGFTGRFDTNNPSHLYNEELVPAVTQFANRTNRVFYLLHEDQAERLNHRPPPAGSLYHLFSKNPARFGTFANIGDYLGPVLAAAKLANVKQLLREYYWDWVNSSRTFMPRELLQPVD